MNIYAFLLVLKRKNEDKGIKVVFIYIIAIKYDFPYYTLRYTIIMFCIVKLEKSQKYIISILAHFYPTVSKCKYSQYVPTITNYRTIVKTNF